MNTFSDPRMIIDQLPLFSGQKVADFGAGNGAYTFVLAEKVQGGSTEGAVYAIDVQQNIIEQLVSEVRTKNMNMVHPIWSDLEDEKGSKLRDNSVQAVVIANTLFQAEHPEALIREARRILTPQGILVIIDWKDPFGNIGPREADVLTEDTAKALVAKSGFVVDRVLQAGEHHYGFVARMSSETTN